MTSTSVPSTVQPGSSWIDLRRQAEYPILLGDSFKDENDNNKFVNFRFNYQPKSGFGNQSGGGGSNGNLTASDQKFRLVVPVDDEDDAANYVYSGKNRPLTNDGSKSLALVFDKTKSAFILESISSTMDMNLVSAPGRSSQFIRGLPQLLSKDDLQHINTNGDKTSAMIEDDEDEDDNADSSNPFDFRHFLSEARENIEKPSSQQPGNRTPLPGNRTPLSGISSPNPTATRIRSNTPQFRPATKPAPTSAPVSKKRKVEDVNQNKQSNRLNTSAQKTKSNTAELTTTKSTSSTRKYQPLSKEKVTDSSDSNSDSNEHNNPIPKPNIKSTKSKDNNTNTQNRQTKSLHSRTDSSSNLMNNSPHIVVNDGDLEIDMGSPPSGFSSSRFHGHHRIDPGAFRSHTSTPRLGLSPNPNPNSKSNLNHRRDIHHQEEEEEEEDDNDDVEQFDLGSPRTQRSNINNNSHQKSVVISNHEDNDEEDSGGDNDAAPTPTALASAAITNQAAIDNNNGDEEDEDEDLFAKAIEAALEEEEEDNDDVGITTTKGRTNSSSAGGTGLGLGILNNSNSNGGGQVDDESEVSEEE